MGKDLKGKELGVGLSQRKDGRYQARFTNNNGKRQEKNFKNKAKAQEWLNEQRYLANRLSDGNMTVDEWYEHWIQNYKEGVVKDNTIKNYKNRYSYNIKDKIGSMRLQEVKNIHCQRILNDMFDSGKYSYGTIELTQITMHAIFKSALENDYINKNPADMLKIKKRNNDKDKEERRVLTIEEQETFKEYAKDKLYYNAYCLVLETGLRAGEIGGLKWEDVDFERKCINVKRTLLQSYKKNGFYFGSPKTKNSKRTIPLTNEAINILKKQQILQNKLIIKSKEWNHLWDGLVFTTINGNPVGASTFRTMMIRVVNNINLDRKSISQDGEYEEFEHCYMHSLRHTFATRCIENGMQPKTLQKILGHSTLSTTMDLYVHVTDEQMFKEMDKMNKVC